MTLYNIKNNNIEVKKSGSTNARVYDVKGFLSKELIIDRILRYE